MSPRAALGRSRRPRKLPAKKTNTMSIDQCIAALRARETKAYREGVLSERERIAKRLARLVRALFKVEP